MKPDDVQSAIGACGFYCGSCPDYVRGECPGCRKAHEPGDCFTLDCTRRQGVEFCGLCPAFPCRELFVREKATVLDRRWLAWKAASQK